MTQRFCLTLLLCYIGVISSKAQLSRQDSIRLQNLLNGNGEININMEAIKDIHFDYNPTKEIMKSKPMMSEDKKWMDYLEDLPKNYLDSTKWTKPKFVRLTPYSIFTKYGEDPVNDPIIGKKDSLKVRMKFNVKMIPGIKNGYRVLPQGMDQNVTPSNNPIGSFSAEDLLAPIFSKKAHIRKHNAKNANAWKTYKNALPVKDSPFSKKKPALKNSDSPKEDSLNIKTDSLKTDSLLYIKRDTLIVPKNNKPVNIVN